MNSVTIKTTTLLSFSCSSFTNLPKHSHPSHEHTHFEIFKNNKTKFPFKSLKYFQKSGLGFNPLSSKPISQNAKSLISYITTETQLETSGTVADKIERLVTEFRSLTEPIDRVKRLLHYAAVLPPVDESARVPANRVTGCTTQVWLEAKMDEFGKMRFGAYSDSEITKGFCSCLIWMLDGAEPEEVLGVKTEDLEEMNVGLHGKAQSRVNTWHNVLISMQKRTKDLVTERKEESPLKPFGSLVIAADGISAESSFVEAQVGVHSLSEETIGSSWKISQPTLHS